VTATPVRIRQSGAITSRDNRWLKTFRAALHSSRPEDGRIALEGTHLVSEAIRSGLKVEALLVSASGENHLAALKPELDGSRQILRTSDKLFASVADTQTPQGIAALARAPEYTLENLLRGADSLVVVLVAAQNPGNVGAILRSAEAFGATGVIASRGTAHPFAKGVARIGRLFAAIAGNRRTGSADCVGATPRLGPADSRGIVVPKHRRETPRRTGPSRAICFAHRQRGRGPSD
jgi:hypothetical protein